MFLEVMAYFMILSHHMPVENEGGNENPETYFLALKVLEIFILI
jgi:hypothetical protein